jgi:hypothetical protein
MKTKSVKRKENLQKILSKMHALGLKAEHLAETAKIVETMKRYHFSIVDIQKEEVAVQGFDLLCVEYDIYKRVPFEEGKKLHPVGIFPFATSNVYISLDEHEWKRSECDENKIPTREFFYHILSLRENLNRCLSILGKPLLEGCYYAKSTYLSDCNWIVGIGGRFGKSIGEDFYGDDERAKYRAVSTFNQ